MDGATANHEFSTLENKIPEGLSSLATTPITEAVRPS